MKNFFYRVKDGDTILSVSSMFNEPTFCLIYENKITREITAGDMLYINQNYNSYVVDMGEDLESIAEKFNIPIEEIKRINGFCPYVFYGLTICLP